MKYESTRGEAPVIGFGDALLTGLAPDGGLYVPTSLPRLPASRPDRYVDLATSVMAPFVDGTLTPDELGAVVEDAYATFDHPDVCPVVDLERGVDLLELFHGPTLAFKDVALQLVGRLFDRELARRDRRATVVVATSGDTGSAAIDACRGRDRLAIVVLHPAGRVSDAQRRQMTTVDEPNVHNVAVEGTFDDCQDIVKALFADTSFRDRVGMAAMNSINWARVLAQTVYYVWAADRTGATADRPMTCVVPTGNFGNILAGWYARGMGAPIERLVIASNRNDILARWVATGALATDEVTPTLSPAMDIQVSSNHERLLFELLDRDGASTAELMGRFRAVGSVEAPRSDVFSGTSLDDDETTAVIGDVHERTGRLIDPHTAVGVGAVAKLGIEPGAVVCLATADPAKFPDAVEAATGVSPPVPERLRAALAGDERYEVAPADVETVRDLVLAAVGA